MALTQNTGEIKVMIVEDHPRIRAKIRGLVEAHADMQVVGEAADGEQAVALADQHEPDVLLLDLQLPILTGEVVLERVLEAHPRIRILILTSYDDPQYAEGLLEQGAAGYMLKEDAPHWLVSVILSIFLDRRRTWVSPHRGVK